MTRREVAGAVGVGLGLLRRWRRLRMRWRSVFEGQSLSYAEFDSRVNRFARYLVSVGVGPESLVGVAVRRSVDLLVAVCTVEAQGWWWVCSGGSGSACGA